MHKSKWAPQSPPPAGAQTTTDEDPIASSIDSSELRAATNQSLLASAPNFAPGPAPPANDDGFAQTFQEDDLFDDVIPVEESMQTRPPENLFDEDFTPVAEPVVENDVPPSRGTRGGNKRGRGGRDGGKGRGAPQGRAQSQRTVPGDTHSQPPEGAPTGPRRGLSTPNVNREHTGGARKPKLTESELAERIASIKLKNESLTAAHARAEADRASFAEREEKAKKDAVQNRREIERRAKEERRDRQEMMGERERNRMRKLKAMEGREWDSEKQEEDFRRGGKFDKKGFAGDLPDYTDGREYMYQDTKGPKGGARGAREAKHDKSNEQALPKPEEFPVLPVSKAEKERKPIDDGKQTVDLKPSEANGSNSKSWAEQVESVG